jgi:hypothetical protein
MISNFKDGSLGDLWRNVERWSKGEWGWRRRLFVWEETLLEELVRVLPGVELKEEEDEWRWVLEDNGSFSVKSVYLLLGRVFGQTSNLSDQDLRVLNNIWKSPAPSKVIAFAWKLLRYRISTRVNLEHRGINVNGGVRAVFFVKGGVKPRTISFSFVILRCGCGTPFSGGLV